MHTFVDAKQTEICEDAIAHLALEIALFTGDMLVHMDGEFVAFTELLTTNVADIKTEIVFVFHVGDYLFGFSTHRLIRGFGFAQEADVDASKTIYYLV